MDSETDLFMYYTPKNPKKLINPKRGYFTPVNSFVDAKLMSVVPKLFLSKYIIRFYIKKLFYS